VCGIVGYTGYREALPVLLSSLERVTYRGYDSFGVALLNGQGIAVAKSLGTVAQHREKVGHLQGTLGIGHTRWATVGGVSLANAHPHSDCSGDLALVHNGHIDNFHRLRQRLQDQGHRFRSQTDSEVIAHLIESYAADDIVAATSRAMGELEGPFALVLLHRPSRRLVVARRESPLVVGLGQGETFIASDVPAILPYTNRILYLEDGDLALVWEGGLTVWQEGFEADRPVHQVNWSAHQISKGGYDHFMLKEIHQQPDAIRDTVAEGLPGPAAASLAAARGVLPVAEPDALLLLGCGTSYHAALLGEHLLAPLLPVPVTARVASECQGPAIKAQRGLAVAFSQSGETSDTLAALRRVKSAGYAALGVTNVMGSSLTRMADATLYTRAGPEVAVASTKTFLAQLVALYLLGYYLSPDRAAVATLPQDLRVLPSKVRQTLANESAVRQAARGLAGCEHLFIVAKGLGVPVALEGALKFKEVAYLHTEGYPAGELKHGPFALLSEATAVIALVLDDQHRTRVLTSIKEIKARGSRVVAIAQPEDKETAQFVDLVLTTPKLDPLLSPVLPTVVLQLLAYHCARERGCPIDRPRNLAKSVTVP
jgi:glucosamine--fructose-6-phosphate aminotransferase (isomerizing)